MTAAAEPRLTGGIFASVLLHGGLVAAFFLLRPPPPPPSPPLYQVHLLAAPPGPRAAGVVQDQTQPPVEKPVPPAPAKATPTPTRPVPAPPKAKPKAVPKVKAATPPPAPVKTPAKPETPQPIAGGGETGGKGADVANVDTPGIEFPYPVYTNNIVRQLIIYLGHVSSRDTAVVRFVIRRDGTVDPESIRPIAGSSYSFTQRALAAVEAAADAKVFGPLPPGFREDILPVTFRFTPLLFR